MTETRADHGFIFGRELESDPLMTSIKLARFKFVAKMLSPNDRVLDLGCGSGYCSYFYSRYAKQVLGVDLFSDMTEAAARLISEQTVPHVIEEG